MSKVRKSEEKSSSHPLTSSTMKSETNETTSTFIDARMINLDPKPTLSNATRPFRPASRRNEHHQPRMTTNRDDNDYNMALPLRGVCAIFNNVKFSRFPKRTGSDKDVSILNDTFTCLGFQVEIYTDLDLEGVEKTLKKLSEDDYEDCSCFCLIVMTHGGDHGVLHTNNKPYYKEMLWESFLSCRTLLGKPKLFFIQACRGDKGDRCIELMKNIDGNTATSYMIPARADYLIAHSTSSDSVSFREEEGSWYIRSLCNVLKEEHQTTDLVTMLTKVHRRVALDFASTGKSCYYKEMPSFTSMLMRKVYFKSS